MTKNSGGVLPIIVAEKSIAKGQDRFGKINFDAIGRKIKRNVKNINVSFSACHERASNSFSLNLLDASKTTKARVSVANEARKSGSKYMSGFPFIVMFPKITPTIRRNMNDGSFSFLAIAVQTIPMKRIIPMNPR